MMPIVSVMCLEVAFIIILLLQKKGEQTNAGSRATGGARFCCITVTFDICSSFCGSLVKRKVPKNRLEN